MSAALPKRRGPGNGPRLGEMLIASGLITDDDLEDALAEQAGSGERLGQVLVARGFLRDVDLARTLAEHLGHAFVDLDERPIDPSALRDVRQSFAERNQLLPFGWEDDVLLVAMANPNDVFALDDVRSLTGRRIRSFMAEPGQLTRAINRIWNADASNEAIQRIEQEQADEAGGIDRLFTVGEADDAPVIQFVNQLITRAVNERASDVHLEPADRQLRVRFRIDGVLHDVMTVPRSAQASIVSRVKIMAEINIAERRIPQDGRMSLRLGGRLIALRVATLPTAYGESVVLRLLEETEGVLSLPDLGFEPRALAVYEAAYRRPWGSILITGPTGSGKSTTLYATVAELNDPSRNIVTIEDPIEYRMNGIKQMQVNRKAGLTFASALRSILRADPDVVLVGEVRDSETARIATEAALTGHLVLSSLHTNDAASAPIRLLDMGIEAFLVTSSLNCIVAQRLARRLCERCREPYAPEPRQMLESGLPGWLSELEDSKFFHAAGCTPCAGTGYMGRVGINEVMPITEEVSHLIATGATPREVNALAIEQGMRPMLDDGLRKAAAGDTTIEEVLRTIR
ncbi:MAG: GspE/PulE family protein [Acidimicrobiales bacterium]